MKKLLRSKILLLAAIGTMAGGLAIVNAVSGRKKSGGTAKYSATPVVATTLDETTSAVPQPPKDKTTGPKIKKAEPDKLTTTYTASTDSTPSQQNNFVKYFHAPKPRETQQQPEEVVELPEYYRHGSLRIINRQPENDAKSQGGPGESGNTSAGGIKGLISDTLGGLVNTSGQSSAPATTVTTTPAPYAARGRMLECELVMTVDSIVPNTPVIALVTQDLWWEGELVIPANTEVHGTATVDVGGERIVCGTSWYLVLRYPSSAWDKKELSLTGLALNQDVKLDGKEQEGLPDSWGISDGSLGLPGILIKAAGSERIRMLLAGALSEAGSALQDRFSDSNGNTQTSATPRNAALQAGSSLLLKEMERIEAEIAKTGMYVRVPAGKTFYLYVTQPIDLSTATKGIAPLASGQPQAAAILQGGMEQTNQALSMLQQGMQDQ